MDQQLQPATAALATAEAQRVLAETSAARDDRVIDGPSDAVATGDKVKVNAPADDKGKKPTSAEI